VSVLHSNRGMVMTILNSMVKVRAFTGLLQGLQQHLEATHDLFVYGFSRDHPDVVPTVNVHIAPDVYNSHGEFVQLDIDAYHMPANKVNGQRAAIVLWWAAARLAAGERQVPELIGQIALSCAQQLLMPACAGVCVLLHTAAARRSRTAVPPAVTARRAIGATTPGGNRQEAATVPHWGTRAPEAHELRRRLHSQRPAGPCS
jgi:hypothetical protein